MDTRDSSLDKSLILVWWNLSLPGDNLLAQLLNLFPYGLFCSVNPLIDSGKLILDDHAG
jgi:hypothetical protein